MPSSSRQIPVRARGPFTALALVLLLALTPLIAQPAAQASVEGPDYAVVNTGVADLVINGLVVGESETITTIGGLHLVTEVEVTNLVDGATAERVLIETPGGVNAAGLRQVVSHQPAFSDGDHVQLALVPAPRTEAGVISAIWSDDRLPVYSVANGMSGTAWIQGSAESQAERFEPEGPTLTQASSNASGDFIVNGAQWNAFPVDYSINPSGAPAGAVNAVRSAIDTWEAVPNIDIEFTYTGTSNSTGPIGDFDNVIAWTTPANPADTFLAQATWWMAAGGTTVAFDIIFNSNFNHVIGNAAGGFDVESVALHEFGHVLGLSHVNVSTEVMNPTIVSGTVRRCLLYTSPSPRDATLSRMPSSA